MPLDFSNAVGSLPSRLGKLGLLLKQMRTHQAAQQTNLIDTTTGVVAQFNGEPDIQAQIGSTYIGILNGVTGVGSLAQQVARDTLNRMVFRDNPRISQTLESVNILDSLNYLNERMRIQGASFLAMILTTTVGSSFTNPLASITPGNGVIVASTRRPSDGKVLENAIAETLLLTCSADSYSGGTSAGNETFAFTGTGSQSNVYAFNWPLGSDASTTLSAINGNADNSSGNKLTNSGFTNWTGNTPDKYAIEVGVAGTQVNKEVSNVYDTGAALRITGDSAGTLTRLAQRFNSSTGTLGTLASLSQYSFNIFAKRDGTAPAAGQMAVELVDGSGNVINDMNGNANTFTIDLTGTNLDTNYKSFTGVFRTPALWPPSAYYWRLRMLVGQALTNGRSVYFDKASLGLMTQSTTGGIYGAVHAGSINFVKNDYNTIVLAKNMGGNLDTFQVLMYRLFPEVGSNEILFKSDATFIA